jgi:excisionase family DNA binding protein
VFVVLVLLWLFARLIGLSATEPGSRPVRRLYPIAEVAEALGGVTYHYVWQLIQSGELGSVKLGRRRLVPGSELDAFIASLKDGYKSTRR